MQKLQHPQEQRGHPQQCCNGRLAGLGLLKGPQQAVAYKQNERKVLKGRIFVGGGVRFVEKMKERIIFLKKQIEKFDYFSQCFKKSL